MTMTLELTDDVIAYLEKMSPEERNHFAVDALREKIEDVMDSDESEDSTEQRFQSGQFPNPLRREDCTPEDIEAIEEGLADIEAGRMIDGDTFFARHFARVGLQVPSKENK